MREAIAPASGMMPLLAIQRAPRRTSSESITLNLVAAVERMSTASAICESLDLRPTSSRSKCQPPSYCRTCTRPLAQRPTPTLRDWPTPTGAPQGESIQMSVEVTSSSLPWISPGGSSETSTLGVASTHCGAFRQQHSHLRPTRWPRYDNCWMTPTQRCTAGEFPPNSEPESMRCLRNLAGGSSE